MGRASEFILHWMKDYLKNADLIKKNIVSMKKEDDCLVVEYKDKTVKVYASESLSQLFGKLTQGDYKTKQFFCVFNTKENLNSLIERWNMAIGYPKLIIYFINPDSVNENKWVICPYVHNKIADTQCLKQGLKSVSQSVDYITNSQIKKVINKR